MISRGRALLIAWGCVALTAACVPLASVLISHAQAGSLGIAAELRTPFPWVGILAFAIVGALIVSRHPRHTIGWIFCLSGLAAGASAVTETYAELARSTPGALPAVSIISAISNAAFVVGFLAPTTVGLLLFPDGRLPSNRWRPILYFAVGSLALQFIGRLVDRNGAGASIVDLGVAGSIAASVASVVSLAVRSRAGTYESRQQIKWVAVAGLVTAVDLIVVIVVAFLQPSIDVFLAFDVAYTTVPIAVGIAILRYHLYDVDLIINKAFVYAGLTAILAGLYALILELSQRLFVRETGSTSETALLITVFVVATAVTPVRNGMQKLADRHIARRDPVVALQQRASNIESVLSVLDTQRLARELVQDASELLDAAGAQLYLNRNGRHELFAGRGEVNGSKVAVALHGNDQVVGRLLLGARRGDAAYSRVELAALQSAADAVGHALVFASSMQAFRPSKPPWRHHDEGACRDLERQLGKAADTSAAALA